MRQHERNAAAESIITALVFGEKITESEARSWIRNVLRVERDGFSQRILRRLPEARYYHSPRDAAGRDELLSSQRVEAIIHEEVKR